MSVPDEKMVPLPAQETTTTTTTTTTHPTKAEDGAGSGSVPSVHSRSDVESVTQAGVREIEAVAKAWSKWGLIVAYVGIFLMAFASSLEGQVSFSMSVFATSSFSTHALIATVYVVQGVVMAVVKPIMAKVGDVFGRLEAFSIAVLLYVLGYIQQATSNNVETFAAAQLFWAAGFTGTQILQQVFIADTSDLLWRAMFSSLPDVPFLVTVWVGPEITASLLASTTWRWGYAIWAIVLPVAFLPFAASLFLNGRRAKRMGIAPAMANPFRDGVGRGLLKLAQDLDVVGVVLLSAAWALILIPLTIARNQSQGWNTPHIVAMIVLGFACLVAFPFWEGQTRLNPHPLIPLGLFGSRTFCAGCMIGFFYFMVFYMSIQPYFYSYLLVVQRMPIATAGRITQTFSFTSTVSSLAVSLLIWYTKRYKYWVTAGALVYMLGIGLMIRYRTEDASVGQLVGCQIAVGIGGGMLNVPAQLGVQAASGHQSVAAATAVFLTMVEIGGAVGSAISGAIWTNVVPRRLDQLLPEASKANASTIFGSHVYASALEWDSPERRAVNAAYQAGMTQLLTVAVCICVPIVLLSWLMRNIALDEVEQGVKGRVIGGRIGDDEKKVGPVGAPGGVFNPTNWRRKGPATTAD